MSKIKGSETILENRVRKYLFSRGYRYRKNDKRYPGKPDIVLPKFRTVIFINGCFWHGHDGCKFFVVPKTRTDFWLDKINTTKTKDKLNYERLTEDGWNIVVLWECDLEKNFEKQMVKLEKALVKE